MTVYYEDDHVRLYHGDCLDVLRTLPDASVDAVVTDPPYNLTAGKKGGSGEASVNLDSPYGRSRIGTGNGGGGFMGKGWDDYDSFPGGFYGWCEAWSRECLRVLKPGGHMLAFGGTRTWHRLACAVEDAGFEIRDSIAWLYGSGFPKSLDVSKAIDKAAGAEREVVGAYVGPDGKPRPHSITAADFRSRAYQEAQGYRPSGGEYPGEAKNGQPRDITAPATPDAERWQGWGTALKPAFEPIVVARKPLAGTVAANVLEHGTGALNIDGCRIGTGADKEAVRFRPEHQRTSTNAAEDGSLRGSREGAVNTSTGRWPTNVALDDTQAAVLDEQSGESSSVANVRKRAGTSAGNGETLNHYAINEDNVGGFNDSGGASRFFPTFRYEAKAPASERPKVNGTAHPTVKPLDLMRWLVRLVTPPGGTVLEPFAGSGTTVEACVIEGFKCIAIEKTDEYLPLTVARINRQRNPVEAIRLAGDDLGLFEGLEGMGA